MTYKRFYKLLNRLPVHDDEMKERLVLQYTGGRTSSLREMTAAEYDTMCNALDQSTTDPQNELRKKKRSFVLHLMQQLGIDTTDWARINAFCRDRRITGKEFRMLTLEELDALTVKLRTIRRNGGLNPQPVQSVGQVEQPRPQIIFMPSDGLPN